MTGADPDETGRQRWHWLALAPLGIGCWAPILGADKWGKRWWVIPAILWSTVDLAGFSMATIPGQTAATIGGLLLFAAWIGGAITSFWLAGSIDINRSPWPRPTERSRTWTVRFALIAYVVTFIAPNAIGLLLHAAGIKLQIGPAAMIVEVFLIGAVIPLRRRYGLSAKDLGLRATPGLRSMALAFLVLLLYFGGTVGYVYAVGLNHAERSLSVVHYPNTVNEILDMIALAVTAPIAEEIFFRGILYRSLRNRLKVLPAALIAGCLFGLVHATGYPLITLPVKAFFGVLACLLYERTGSLLPGIAVHSFVDGSSGDIALFGNDFLILGFFGVIVVGLFVNAGLRRHRAAAVRVTT